MYQYILIVTLLSFIQNIEQNSTLYNLRINHLKQPLGIDVTGNLFSFQTEEKGPFKASLQLGDKIIETKEILLNQTHAFYFNEPFQYNTTYKYIIESSLSKAELEFETALKLEAPFIKPNNKDIFCPIFVKNFNITKEIKKARLYITGLGLYLAFINNEKVGNGYLTPGYNDYEYYLRYQTYDITNMLKEQNKIEIEMGNGWYKGRFHFNNQNNIFGDEYKLCLHLLIEFKDETFLNIVSDESWKVKSSKEVANSIYDGEQVDYTLPELPLDDVIISNENYNLIPDYGLLIVEHDILYPELYISPKGEQILDFKQNMVGFVRFKGNLKKNQTIIMKHGEVLQEDCFYNLNYRTASNGALIFKGDGEKRVYEPKFTFFGFRYVLVEGLEKVDPKEFEGIVIYSDLEKTIECKTDNDKINQLIHNAYWGQRGNFLDVPTDCPQRDERLGWTGDTQVFSNTACYNMDSYIFYKKFMSDLRGDQLLYLEGDIAAYSPSLKQPMHGGAVWADVATILPWNIYLNYGDKNLLIKFYPMMKEYIETLITKDINQGNLSLILNEFTFGDWLAQDGEDPQSTFGGTDNGFINSVYYYYSVNLISLTAKELGYIEDYERYSQLKQNIYKAIIDYYFFEDGKLNLNTQTSYLLCLHYKIYKNKEIIIKDLIERIKKDLYRLKTGFTGTPLILLSLFDNGMDDYAYRILYNEEFPGWLYTINLGATTIWERWNSLLEDGTISGIDMNSFNHYAYGSVCETIYSRIAGLRNIGVGWKKVMIKPHLNYRMKKIDFSYNSISGKYEIHWKWKEENFEMNITIPNGCEAEIILPNGKEYNEIGGNYHYECKLDKKIYNPFSIDTPIIDLIKNDEAKNILKEFLPQVLVSIESNDGFKANSIRSASSLPNFVYSPDTIKKCDEELSKIIP